MSSVNKKTKEFVLAVPVFWKVLFVRCKLKRVPIIKHESGSYIIDDDEE